mgnify:CR=1 FL=1
MSIGGIITSKYMMERFKNAFAGFGMMGGAYGMGPDSLFDWIDWVSTVLMWALMLVAIIAIVKYISKD